MTPALHLDRMGAPPGSWRHGLKRASRSTLNELSLSRLDTLVAKATVELFHSYGIALEPAASGGVQFVELISSAIGFSSDRLRGVLVLSLDRGIAAKSLPLDPKPAASSEETLVDWTGELSNQMLGRLKNGLHAAGLDISLGTPERPIPGDRAHYPIRRLLAFAGGGAVIAELHAEGEEGLEIGEAEPGATDALAEGEALFF